MQKLLSFQSILQGLIVVIVLCTSCIACIRNTTNHIYAPGDVNMAAYIDSVALLEWSNPDGSGGILGTGFAVSKDHIMTAGHVCQAAVDNNDGAVPLFLMTIYNDHGIPSNLSMGSVVFIDPEDDICILYAPGHPLEVLPISTRYEDLTIGREVVILGWPGGKFEPGTYLISLVADEGLLLRGAVYHGHSGSPVVLNGEVIGLVSAFHTEKRYVTLCVPAPELQEALNTQLGAL